MNITSAQYIRSLYDDSNDAITAVIDGQKLSVPIDPANRHYQAILEWAEEDSNEIAAAD
jgi:hypothetical protein